MQIIAKLYPGFGYDFVYQPYPGYSLAAIYIRQNHTLGIGWRGEMHLPVAPPSRHFVTYKLSHGEISNKTFLSHDLQQNSGHIRFCLIFLLLCHVKITTVLKDKQFKGISFSFYLKLQSKCKGSRFFNTMFQMSYLYISSPPGY